MSHIEIASYLAGCRSLAVRELERLLPSDSALGGAIGDSTLNQPSSPSAGLGAALCLATCRALGGADVNALPAAAVMELYQSASEPTLRSSTERVGAASDSSQACTYAELAGNESNAVLALVFEPLLDRCRTLGFEQTIKVLQAVGRMARETAEGRAIEANWVRNGVWALSDADYRGMVLKKWGWHGFVAPTKIGAIVAGANGEQIASLEQFAADLGFAFQLYDDVNELSRSHEGKHTLPLMHALRSSAPQQRARMERTLLRARPLKSSDNGTSSYPPPSIDEETAFIHDRIRESGGVEYAQHIGNGYALRARAALDRARSWGPGSKHGRLLYALAEFTLAKAY